ncbi:DUF6049 family protein [Brachybacterium hainanense]|uniref:DUF6049 family protein n=1 Tax=Brachybacterium hainanense TaxID=1541174 RepID=A0ABV6RFY8_9MICO
MPQSAPTSSGPGTGRSSRPAPPAAAVAPGTGRRSALRAAASTLVICLLVLLAPAGAQALPQPDDFDGAAHPLRLEQLGPVALAPGGTLTAEITITNTSSAVLRAPRLEVRARSARITDRDDLQSWQQEEAVDARGDPAGTSAPAADLAPGASATVSVAVPADELGFSPSPDLWGPRRLSVTLVSEDTALASLRTFTIWRPAGATSTMRQSVLVPVASQDPAAQVADPEAFTAEATSGPLAREARIAAIGGVDWLLDPSLLDPPVLAVEETEEPGSGEGTPTAGEAPPETSPAPGGAEPAPHPPAAQLAEQLREGAEGRTVLGAPYAGADLVSLQEEGAQELRARAGAASRATWAEQGVDARALALALPAQETTGTELQAAQRAGAGVLIVPQSAVDGADDPRITRSSLAQLSSEDGTTSLILPDTRLSAQLSTLREDAAQGEAPAADEALTRQRILAETAAVAAQDVPAARHLVMMPQDAAALDAEAVTRMMSDLEDAPWVERAPVGQLLDAVPGGTTTSEPLDEQGRVLTAGEIAPAQILGDAAAPPARLDEAAVRSLESSSARLEELAAVMEDDATLDALRLQILAATGTAHRTDADGQRALADGLGAEVEELRGAVTVAPASEYTLVADSAGVPITVANRLDTPITVQVAVTADTHVVRIGEVPPLTVPARGSAQVTVPVEAIANGTVTLTTNLSSTEGSPLTAPVQTPLSVNPAWENWTTMALMIGMGLLVIVGVLRARRTGSAARAPGVKAPEDPAVLASTGRSQPVAGTMDAETDPGADPDHEEPEPSPPPEEER